jgi:DDE superfamily endonuclease
VILNGTLLRIDRVGMAGDDNRGFYSSKHQCHGLNVQVIADPAGRLVGISPVSRPARHRHRPRARHHRPLNTAKIDTVADTAYQGGGPAIRVPQRRRRLDPDTGRYRRLSRSQKEVNTAHARQRGPGERQRRTQELAHPAQHPLQPQPRGQARRRSSDPRDRQRLIRLAKTQCP